MSRGELTQSLWRTLQGYHPEDWFLDHIGRLITGPLKEAPINSLVLLPSTCIGVWNYICSFLMMSQNEIKVLEKLHTKKIWGLWNFSFRPENILWQKYWGEHANNINKRWSFCIPFSLTSTEIGERQNNLFKEIIRKQLYPSMKLWAKNITVPC